MPEAECFTILTKSEEATPPAGRGRSRMIRIVNHRRAATHRRRAAARVMRLRYETPSSLFMLASSAGVNGYWSNSALATHLKAFTARGSSASARSVHS